MPRQSAGLLVYRGARGPIEVFLVHPGGPFWAKKDYGAWSIPKGEFSPPEDALDAAKREFVEETGLVVTGQYRPLDPVKQPGGKLVLAWSVNADLDPAAIRSNLFSMEWPPRSGLQKEFPEVDRAQWFSLTTARHKILKGLLPLLDQLEHQLGLPPSEGPMSPPKPTLSERDDSAQGSFFHE